MLKALNENHLEKLKYLVDRYSISLEFKDNHGDTMLAKAAMKSQWNIVKYLCGQGANVNTTNIEGHTPLHYAVSFNSIAVIDTLIKYGASENIKNNAGATPWEATEQWIERPQ